MRPLLEELKLELSRPRSCRFCLHLGPELERTVMLEALERESGSKGWRSCVAPGGVSLPVTRAECCCSKFTRSRDWADR